MAYDVQNAASEFAGARNWEGPLPEYPESDKLDSHRASPNPLVRAWAKLTTDKKFRHQQNFIITNQNSDLSFSVYSEDGRVRVLMLGDSTRAGVFRTDFQEYLRSRFPMVTVVSVSQDSPLERNYWAKPEHRQYTR